MRSLSEDDGWRARKRRPQILSEAGRPLELGYVPQTHEPAAEAEVDFHDLWVILRGVKTKTALFTMPPTTPTV